MGAWQALVAIAGLFGLSSGSGIECYKIENHCGKGLYLAFGYVKSGWTNNIVELQTIGWYRHDGRFQRQYCFRRLASLYAFFDFVGSTTGHYQSDLAFTLGEAQEFCLSQRRSHIIRSAGESGSLGFTDELSGRWASRCEGLGIGATMRAFQMIDDGNVAHAATIPSSVCPTWQGSNATPVPVLEVSHQPLDPNSTDVEQVINATHPLAVFVYHPETGWSVEEPQSGPDQSDQESEEPLLP
eukprot:Skav220643  [mRNA]  locus=scaffold112:642948:643670:- [translate_table: standard]